MYGNFSIRICLGLFHKMTPERGSFLKFSRVCCYFFGEYIDPGYKPYNPIYCPYIY